MGDDPSVHHSINAMIIEKPVRAVSAGIGGETKKHRRDEIEFLKNDKSSTI